MNPILFNRFADVDSPAPIIVTMLTILAIMASIGFTVRGAMILGFGYGIQRPTDRATSKEVRWYWTNRFVQALGNNVNAISIFMIVDWFARHF